MMISYSSNYEDVMLARAFNGTKGRYIDIGAHTPVDGSNTYALYARGWDGVACDPIFGYEPQWVMQWSALRPRDLLVRDAIGAEMGETGYWLCNYRGMSTCDRGRIDEFIKKNGTNSVVDDGTKVQVVTLDRVIEKLLEDKAPHLICIDVEGFEGNVLKGIDLVKHRPWVFCIESYVPHMAPHYPNWEPQLLAAGYHWVWDDHLNRFYVADEQAARLDQYFIYPPNYSDGFIRHREYEQQRRIEEYEANRANVMTLR
jgi:FkbM family methyltransferase